MKRTNKGGRPSTDRKISVTFRVSERTMELLNKAKNKTDHLNALINGDKSVIRCPHCGEVITLKKEEL